MLVLLVGVERLTELVVSNRNAAWALARGGVESGRGHDPPMVVRHTGLLVGALAEVLLPDRPFVPALGWTALAVAAPPAAARPAPVPPRCRPRPADPR